MHEVFLETDVKNKGDAFQTAAASSVKDASHTNASPVEKPQRAFLPRIILQRLFESNPVSKVVDENGEPMVMYRGDDGMESRGYESGMFVSRSKDEASGHGKVHELFVSAKKIFDGEKDFDLIEEKVKENFETIKDELREEVAEWQMEKSYEDWDNFVNAIKSQDWMVVERSNTLLDIIKSRGYDAIEIYEGANNPFFKGMSLDITFFMHIRCPIPQRNDK